MGRIDQVRCGHEGICPAERRRPVWNSGIRVSVLRTGAGLRAQVGTRMIRDAVRRSRCVALPVVSEGRRIQGGVPLNLCAVPRGGDEVWRNWGEVLRILCAVLRGGDEFRRRRDEAVNSVARAVRSHEGATWCAHSHDGHLAGRVQSRNRAAADEIQDHAMH